MKRVAIVVALITLSLSGISEAQQITNPIRYTWIATSYPDWDTALSAFIQLNGQPNVLVLSTGRDDRPWVILKRVEEGSIFIPDDEPFRCDVFLNVGVAMGAYVTTDTCHGPMFLNVPDGRAVIVATQKCEDPNSRRRAVR